MTDYIKIAPSILASDFGNLASEIAAVDEAGADWIHLDIMDGVFVSNFTFGPPIVKAGRGASKKFFDAHLMVADPDPHIAAFREAGADGITIHLEAKGDTAETLKAIKETGANVGLAIKPETPAAKVKPFLDMVNLILVMTVNPGFGGQAFMRDVVPKIAKVREMVGDRDIDIQVDGGITRETAPLVAEAGANVLVAGSSVFGCGGATATAYEINITGLRHAIGKKARKNAWHDPASEKTPKNPMIFHEALSLICYMALSQMSQYNKTKRYFNESDRLQAWNHAKLKKLVVRDFSQQYITEIDTCGLEIAKHFVISDMHDVLGGMHDYANSKDIFAGSYEKWEYAQQEREDRQSYSIFLEKLLYPFARKRMERNKFIYEDDANR